jgi:hypothetical protein
VFKKGAEFLGDQASKAQTASHVKAQETRKSPSYFCSELSRKRSTEIHRPVTTQEPNVQVIASWALSTKSTCELSGINFHFFIKYYDFGYK